MISLDDSVKSLRNEKIKKIYVYEGDEQVAVIEKSSIFTNTKIKELLEKSRLENQRLSMKTITQVEKEAILAYQPR